MYPAMIKDGEAFVDGSGYFGKVQELGLPSLTVKTEEIQAGGMIAPMDVSMGLAKLEASLKLYEWNEDVIKKFDTVNNKAVQLAFRFAAEREDASEQLTPIEVHLHGRFINLEFSAFSKSAAVPLDVTVAVNYFRYVSNNQDLVEIDIPNMIYKINGDDRYAQRRDALGRN